MRVAENLEMTAAKEIFVTSSKRRGKSMIRRIVAEVVWAEEVDLKREEEEAEGVIRKGLREVQETLKIDLLETEVEEGETAFHLKKSRKDVMNLKGVKEEVLID